MTSGTVSNIKLVVLDVDGTLTDGGIYILESGDQLRKFNAKDGLGVKLAIKHGLIVGIISHGMTSDSILTRVEMLGIQKCYIGQRPKLEVLRDWCRELDVSLSEVAFVGDDVNDMDIIEVVGLTACPANAVTEVMATCDVVLTHNGGAGCVREFLDLIRLQA